MTFTFQYELGQPEQVRASRVMYHRRRDTRVTYACLLASPVVVFLFHLYLRAHGREGWWPGLVIVAAALVVGLLAAYMMARRTRQYTEMIEGPLTGAVLMLAR